MSQQNKLEPIVLSKGLGSGSRSEEFRVVFPEHSLTKIGQHLDAISNWSSVLTPLYERTTEDLSRQFAILLTPKELGVFCVAPTRDHFRRRSVVIAGLVSPRGSSHDSQIATSILSRVRSYIPEIASTIEHGGRKNLEYLVKGLTTIDDDSTDTEMVNLLSQILNTRYQYKGAATPLCLGFGADILIGTSHEALNAERHGIKLKAYYDVRTEKLLPLRANMYEFNEEYDEDDNFISSSQQKPQTTKELLNQTIRRVETLEEELEHLKMIQEKILKSLKWRWFD